MEHFGPAEQLERAWALKAECYAAWSVDPPRALRAAQALGAMSKVDETDIELKALADWTEGIACLIRSRMTEAVTALDQSSRRWRAISRPLEAAHAQVPKIMALAVLGRFDEAQACALGTEAELRREGDEQAAAKVRLNLGSLAFSRDNHAQAVAHYRAAAVLFARIGDREHSVMADIGLADALSYLGRLAEARRIYARARMRADAHGLPVLAATADNGSALAALAQGRYREALAGLEATRRAFGKLELEHRRIEAEKSLADAYLEVRLLPEAIAIYTGLVASMRADAALATLPWVQAQLARAQALSGQPDVALHTLAEAWAGFDAQRNAVGVATVWSVQSELHLAAGRPHEAAGLAQRADTAFGHANLPGHQAAARLQALAAQLQIGEPARVLGGCEALLADADLPPQVRVRAQVERAVALLQLSRRDEARAALDEAIERIEQLRAALPGDDLRRAFMADATRPFVQRLQLALDDAADGPDSVHAVLHWLERFKARALHERLGERAHPAHSVDSNVALRERLDWIYRRQQRLVEDKGESPQALREEAARLERDLLESARRDRLLIASTCLGSRPDAAFDTQALQRALGAERAMVAYGVVGDELFAVSVREGAVRLFRRLASWTATTAVVQGLRFQIDAMRAGSPFTDRHLALLCERTQRRLAQLHRLVWRPIQCEVAGCDRLVIVPHGALHGVPFAALGEGKTVLVDHHELVTAASANVALHGLLAVAETHPPQRVLAFGETSRLAHVAAELRTVTAAFRQTRVFEGAQARVASLHAEAAQVDVLHLACHARFRADSPLFSALQLADGALTADQVEGLQLRARLVVLSACESALGAAGVVDEGVGLVRAFLMAGATRVLGSHWSVDDTATAEFMHHFYGRWRADTSVAAAVAQAQRDMRNRWPHPAHWAAFALHGAG